MSYLYENNSDLTFMVYVLILISTPCREKCHWAGLIKTFRVHSFLYGFTMIMFQSN